MKIRLLVLGLVLFVSSLTVVNAQQHWHFFDCFSQFEPDFLTGPFNLEITDVFLDNNGTPWVQAGISGGTAFYFGRVVNGQWEFIDFPSSLQNFPPFLSNRASLVFDDSNVPWMTPGFVDMAQMVGLGTGLHKIENGGFNGIANTEWAVNVKKFNNDPLLYLLSNHKLARVSPASPSNVTYIYEQAEGVAPITLVDKAPNGDLFLYKRNSSTDSIVRVDTQGNTVGYDLSSIISQFSQNILVLDMKVDGNGSVWLYVSTGFVHTLIRYDFGNYDIYNQNSPVSLPDAMCTNMEMDENNDIWLFYEGYVVRFSNGVFNIEQAIGGPFWTTMGYSKMHFRKDAFDNIWYIGILEPDARYGLAVVNPSGLETIGGSTFIDWNQNQVFDAGDASISIPIQTTSGFTFSQPDGTFQIFTTEANTLITVNATLPPYFDFTTPSSYSVTPSIGPTTGLDFGIYPNQTIQDLAVSQTSGPCRPGFVLNQWVTFENNGTTISDATITLDFDQELSYTFGQPAPSTINGNQLSWNFTEIQPFENGTIYLQFEVDSAAVLGDTLDNSISIDPVNQDAVPIDNALIAELPVIGSFDPNDKTATPSDVTEAGEWIDYHIRFQNTGTDTAFNIYLKDTIDFNLNQSTLEIIGNSHPMRYTLTNDVLEFWFDDVLLPDSNTNEALSHGFVKYKIKTEAALVPGDAIKNTAYIYFDFNQPVITNTTVNTVPFPDAIDELTASASHEIFPNPNTGSFILKLKNELHNKLDIGIYDSAGRLVFSKTYQTNTSNQYILETGLPQGVYLVKINDENAASSVKLVIK